jgi:hypothetical protein
MNLLIAKKILDDIDLFIKEVNETIGVIKVDKRFSNEGVENRIFLYFTKQNNEVGNFVFEHLYNNLVKSVSKTPYKLRYDNINKNMITIEYILDVNEYCKNHRLIKDISEEILNVIDEAKVEFNLIFEKDFKHEIPEEVWWELDDWVDENDDEFDFVNNLYVYKFNITAAYGLTLGYFIIDDKNLEINWSPELLCYVMDETQNFAYATAYEDDKYIYLYSVKELDEENIAEIEQNIVERISVISESNPEYSFEEYYDNL